MDKEYVYFRTKDISAGLKVEIPKDAICMNIVCGYDSYGKPNNSRYVEWLQPA